MGRVSLRQQHFSFLADSHGDAGIVGLADVAALLQQMTLSASRYAIFRVRCWRYSVPGCMIAAPWRKSTGCWLRRHMREQREGGCFH